MGSNLTHPWPSIHNSTQAWAFDSRTTISSEPSSWFTISPGVKPSTTRLGRPIALAMTAMAVANCSQ